MYRWRGVVKPKADRRGQGEGGGLKTDKSVRASFVNDPLEESALVRNILVPILLV